MGVDPGQQRGGDRAAETCIPRRTTLFEYAQAEPQCRRRVPREPHELGKREIDDAVDMRNQRGEQLPPRGAVTAERFRRPVDVAERQPRRAVVERVRVRHVWHDERHAPADVERLEERRGQHLRMYRRALIVQKARQRHLGRARGTAERPAALDELHRQTGTGQGHGGG